MKQSELAKSLKLFIGLTCIILAICAFVIIPKVGKDIILESPEYSYLYYPFLVFIWITIIPFYAALFEGWKILFVIFIAMCISVFTAVLAHLVQKAYDLKNENDLTI